MTRLIDADAIYKILESCEIKKDTYGSLLNDWDHGYNCGIERAESEIECAPTIDAVPVIRCKDCKYYDGFDCSRYADETYGISHSTQEYGYCWLAERKEG